MSDVFVIYRRDKADEWQIKVVSQDIDVAVQWIDKFQDTWEEGQAVAFDPDSIMEDPATAFMEFRSGYSGN